MPDLAVTELEQAVKLDPNNYLYAYELGKAYFNVKKFEEAQRAFESVTTKLNPKYEPAFFNLGMTYRALNNTAAALDAFRKAIELKPDYVNAHVQTGIVLGRGTTSPAQSSRSRRRCPSSRTTSPPFATSARPSWPRESRQTPSAPSSGPWPIAPTRRPTTTWPRSSTTWASTPKPCLTPGRRWSCRLRFRCTTIQLGLCAEKTGDVDAAIVSYAKAADLDKKAVDPRVNLGKLYLESGFIDKALAILDEAYRIDPKSFEANNNLGNAYEAKGRLRQERLPLRARPGPRAAGIRPYGSTSPGRTCWRATCRRRATPTWNSSSWIRPLWDAHARARQGLPVARDDAVREKDADRPAGQEARLRQARRGRDDTGRA